MKELNRRSLRCQRGKDVTDLLAPPPSPPYRAACGGPIDGRTIVVDVTNERRFETRVSCEMSGKWWLSEALPVLKTVRLLVRSQVGYEVRQYEQKFYDQCLTTAVQGGKIVKPFDPTHFAESQRQSRPSFLDNVIAQTSDIAGRADVVSKGVQTFASMMMQGQYPGRGGFTVPLEAERVDSNTGSAPPIRDVENLSVPFDNKRSAMTQEEEDFLLKAAAEVGATPRFTPKQTKPNKPDFHAKLPKGYRVNLAESKEQSLSDESVERRVPSSRLGRLATFGQLALGLGAGAAAEITRRSFRFGKPDEATSTAERVVGASNPFLTPANAERIVQTLCRVRGAALKLGQMLSIQDSDTVPPYLLEIFDRVRHSADFMPMKQVHKQLQKELGDDWRSKFADFDERPFAAASIGQVHKATTLDGRYVAVKIQYPGVAEGIDSDIDNLVTILNVGRLFPKGMFLDNFVKVARRELKAECDYEREARAISKFRELLCDQEHFYVPGVFRELSTKRVLTTEFIEGKPVDKCMEESQTVRDYIASKFIELCLKEIFLWRFMQTDPNWSNFFFGKHPGTGEPRLILLDFGASRSYPKLFVDRYMHIIRAAYDKDTEKMLKYSREIGFLTGYESKIMEKAHCASISILGETLASDVPYDFSQQTVTKRIHDLIPVMLEHRLTSPPEEIYSLHRKLSGSYLLATKLRATVACGPLFNEIYDGYKFGDVGHDIDIDN
ncbi:hypothetical protein L596_003845 [Steinernema carpocapsae]|uniref:ABC1 atypical kinase-like domain-containing protein n=1 Tax=Steinernema carpocapsae TaxID=34508 RepID=A0A4U8UTX2_STECR|nr:hypothetical protein L596_003845 [Steinernema carpocapsae]